ncbi:ATP-binding protein [Streptomyces sp. NPDC059575]|uniref:ATP-binding protein n=1 Tax=Streptomyces sp. NPDC059575 TaxID=3346872 RepID=UPI0036CA3D73
MNQPMPVLKHAPRPDRDVMAETFKLSSRLGAQPHPEDAVRVGIMRRIAAARLRYHGLSPLVEDVTLIVSELLTNAVQRGKGTVNITMRVDVGDLRITVTDDGAGRAIPSAPSADDESGRGLSIVVQLVRERGGEWGTKHRSDGKDGKHVWCTVPVTHNAQAGSTE